MTGAASPSAAKGRRSGPPVWFAVVAALGILAGLVIIVLEVLGLGVTMVVPGVNASVAPAGSAAAMAHDQVALALQDAGFAVADPSVAYRPGETATLLGTPRRLLQAVIPADPNHGFIVIYEFTDANAADAAGREFSDWLHSGTGGIGYPQDARFVLRRMGSTLVFFTWSPAVSPDPEIGRLASVLESLGNPLSGQ
jgi:hypothetical protein